jgi:hypothetical protein
MKTEEDEKLKCSWYKDPELGTCEHGSVNLYQILYQPNGESHSLAVRPFCEFHAKRYGSMFIPDDLLKVEKIIVGDLVNKIENFLKKVITEQGG